MRRLLALLVLALLGSACGADAQAQADLAVPAAEADNAQVTDEAEKPISPAAGPTEEAALPSIEDVAATQAEAEADEEPAAASLLYQGHASLRIITEDGKCIYIDPFFGEGYDVPADLILITHDHYDHSAVTRIKERAEDCVVISNKEALADGVHQAFAFDFVSVEAVEAGNNANHSVKNCVGYVLTFSNGAQLYVSGDTSKTEQMADMAAREIDYAFFCCDGVYNMDIAEASECAGLVGAKHSIPYHMVPSDNAEGFSRKRAESFEAEGRLILEPGEELSLYGANLQ